MYKSAPYLEEFRRRAGAAVATVSPDYEIVFVDDGSPDESLRIARRLLDGDPHVRIVELSRNYGHHKAVIAGLQHARGDLVFLLDSDLEEKPELFARFYEVMTSAPADDPIDVVYGMQARRKGGWVERATGYAFFWLYNRVADLAVPPHAMMARLMTRRYLDALLAHPETELFLLGVMTRTGFRQIGVVAEKGSRDTTTYSLRRRVIATLDAVTSFSHAPLYVIFWLGLFFSTLASAGIVYLLVRIVIFDDRFLAGWPSVIVVTTLFGGLLLASVGVLGIYLAKVFLEVKRRPRYVVKRVHEARTTGRP